MGTPPTPLCGAKGGPARPARRRDGGGKPPGPVGGGGGFPPRAGGAGGARDPPPPPPPPAAAPPAWRRSPTPPSRGRVLPARAAQPRPTRRRAASDSSPARTALPPASLPRARAAAAPPRCAPCLVVDRGLSGSGSSRRRRRGRSPDLDSRLRGHGYAASRMVTVCTLLPLPERARVDAAGDGCFATLHADSPRELLRAARRRRGRAPVLSGPRPAAGGPPGAGPVGRRCPAGPAGAPRPRPQRPTPRSRP